MPRELKQFTGKCLILGGGWDYQWDRKNEPVPNYKAFYTLNIDPRINPDMVMDITDANAWKQFKDSSFDFIYFEHLPLLSNIFITIQECQRVLSDRGIIMYSGGFQQNRTPYKSFMELFEAANFKYRPYKPPIATMGYIQDSQSERGTRGFAIKDHHELTETFIVNNLPKEAREIIHYSLCISEIFALQSLQYNFYKEQTLSDSLYDESLKPELSWLKLRSNDLKPFYKERKVEAYSGPIGRLPAAIDNTKRANFDLLNTHEMKLEVAPIGRLPVAVDYSDRADFDFWNTHEMKRETPPIGRLPVAVNNTKRADFNLWNAHEMKLEASFALKGELPITGNSREGVLVPRELNVVTSTDGLVQAKVSKKRPHDEVGQSHVAPEAGPFATSSSQAFFSPSTRADVSQQMFRNKPFA